MSHLLKNSFVNMYILLGVILQKGDHDEKFYSKFDPLMGEKKEQFQPTLTDVKSSASSLIKSDVIRLRLLLPRARRYSFIRVFLRWELYSILLGKNDSINSTYDLS